MNDSYLAIQAIHFAIPVFCVAAMFAMGLNLTLDELAAPFSKKLALVIIILANHVLIPLVGFIIVALPGIQEAGILDTVLEAIITLTPEQTVGFLLLTLTSGSLLAPTLAGMANGKVPCAKGTAVVLVIVSAVLIPFEVRLLQLFGLIAGTLDIGQLFNTMLLYQLAPLALGIVIREWFAPIASWLRPLIIQFTSLALLMLFALLPATGRALVVPAQVPDRRLELFPLTTTITVVDLQPGIVPLKMLTDFATSGVTLTSDANLSVIQAGSEWLIVDGVKKYAITSDSSGLEVHAVKAYLFSLEAQNIDELVAQLDRGEPPQVLATGFEQHGLKLAAPQVISVTAGVEWKLVDGDKTHVVKREGQSLRAFSDTVKPVGLLATILGFLLEEPTIETVLKFLKQFEVIPLIPIAVYIVISGLYITIGYYSGLIVQNTVAVQGAKLAQTLATTTAARNVSAALIIAANHLTRWPTQPSDIGLTDLNAILTILVFFLISSVVAAYQAVKWANQPEAVPTAPASQPQAAPIASERRGETVEASRAGIA